MPKKTRLQWFLNSPIATLIFVIAIIGMLALIAKFSPEKPSSSTSMPSYSLTRSADSPITSSDYISATITRVVDGDTVKAQINGVTETVRLIGIDTPETKHPRIGKEPYGQEASDYTTALLEGKKVVLEYDFETRDRYDRLLAYIYLEDATGDWKIDGRYYRQANEEIVLAGLASPMTIAPNNRYAEHYADAVRVARAQNIGMWQ